MTDPKNPTYIKIIPSLTTAQRVWTGENYLFVYTGSAIKIYDLTDPENPLFKADYSAGVDLHKVSAKGNYMFVLYMSEYNTGKDGSFEIVDITNATNPQLKGTYKPSNYEGRSFSFSETANRVYVAHYASGQGYIREIDYSVPTNPTQIRELIITDGPIEISVTGTTMFILKDGGWQGPSKLEAYDLSATPIVQLASLQVSTERAWDMHVYENSITVTLLEANGFKNYTWNATTKVFENGLSLNIPNASQISWYIVSTQGSGSIETLRKTLGGYWIYLYYYVLEKSPSSMESETYGYYERLVEVRIWIEEPDAVKVTLITSVNPAEASADGSTVTPAGTNQYDKNSTVSLNAIAGPGWAFANWTGALSGSQNPQDLKMDDNKNVVGNFQPILVLSLSSPTDNYLCSAEENDELTIATAGIFVDGVDWMLSGISFTVVEIFKPDYTEAWIEYSGIKLKGNISTDADGYATSISFSPSKQIDEGNTLSVRLFYKFNYPSKSTERYIPAALDEVKKYKISIHVGQINCVPIPDPAKPGVKGPPYPPNIFYSNTQTVASVWNVSKNPNIPFESIKQAVESPQTSDNDLIKLCPAWYKENVTLNKPLTIFSGSGYETTVWECDSQKDQYGSELNDIVTIKKSNTKISGITFINAKAAIQTNNSGIRIKNCEIKENYFNENLYSIEGVNLDSSSIHHNYFLDFTVINNGYGNTIEKNTFESDMTLRNEAQNNLITDNVFGGVNGNIEIESESEHNEIKNNKLGTKEDGITPWATKRTGIKISSDLNTIENNIISGTSKAINLLDANNNTIKNNIIGLDITKKVRIPNADGIVFQDEINFVNESYGNIIESNIISGNDHYGIVFEKGSGAHDNIVRENIFGTNENGDKELVNGIGVMIEPGCSQNIIDDNTFGIHLSCLTAFGDGTEITNNRFGTDPTGKKIVFTGVELVLGAQHVTINKNIFANSLMGIIIGSTKSEEFPNVGKNNFIEQNTFGVDITGAIPMPVALAVMIINGAQDNFIENNFFGEISNVAVMIMGKGTTGNYVRSNFMGINGDYSKKFNLRKGVWMMGEVSNNIIYNNTIGGLNADSSIAIFCDSLSQRNLIRGNFIGTNSSGSVRIPNKFGILMRGGSNDNSICQNKIWYNYAGIHEIDCSNNISQNDIRYNTNNTGIHLINSHSKIVGNIIANDEYDGIKCENGSQPLITSNNILENKGYGLHNMDPGVKVNATNNWWGSASGPGNSINGNLNTGNWVNSEIKLVVSASLDTLYIPEGGADSVSALYRNWNNSSDKLNVTVSSNKESWITSSKSFVVDLAAQNSGESKIKLLLPAGIATGDDAWVTTNVVSQSDPSLSFSDTLDVIVYKSNLSSIAVRPDTISCSPGDTVFFRASGFDQHNKEWFEPVVVDWSANGGTIDQTGKFIAGSINGLFKLNAEEKSKHLIAYGFVKIENTLTSVNDDKTESKLPTEYSLSQNYPNPFNPVTKINYSVPLTSNIRITVYNILGQIVKELVNEEKLAGNYNLNWNAAQYASGIYICRIIASGSTKTYVKSIKMILLK